jgi:isopentenyl-diphosphate delta-isomerase
LPASEEVVSFDSDLLILVDEHDHEIGTKRKDACHVGDGTLHRAFSLFLFNSSGELLLQQRALGKRLWPGYWSNSCCSHPRAGETMESAVHRRLYEELGVRTPLRFLYKFQYQAQYDETGAEHELCSVYAGRSDDPILTNANEIEAVRFISPADLNAELAATPERFSPWFKMEWRTIQREFARELDPL